MKRKGYKVVSKRGENYYSAVCISYAEGIEYKLNEYSYPKKGCGALCVFKYYEDAEKFADNTLSYGEVKIFECEYKPSWKRWVYDGDRRTFVNNLSKGKRLAKAVMLLKEVE